MRGSAGGLRKIVRGGERAGEKTLGLYCMTGLHSSKNGLLAQELVSGQQTSKY